jgi:hypothetical protein
MPNYSRGGPTAKGLVFNEVGKAMGYYYHDDEVKGLENIMRSGRSAQNYSTNDKAQVLFDAVEMILEIKVYPFKQKFENALIEILRTVSSDEVSRAVVILGGREKEIAYLMSLYAKAQVPPSRGGIMLG